MTGTAKRKAEEHCSDERFIPANSTSPFVALSGSATLAIKSPVSEVKRTLRLRVPTSEFGP